MKATTISGRLCLPNQALLFDLDALYQQLQRISDRRHRRGVRYPLAEVLMLGVLAKLAGQTSSRAMAEWAHLRSRPLCQLFDLRQQRLPHYSTWSRILGRAVDPQEVERVLGAFFLRPLPQPSRPGQRQLCLDGKTLRGTVPAGIGPGVHLLGPICLEKESW